MAFSFSGRLIVTVQTPSDTEVVMSDTMICDFYTVDKCCQTVDRILVDSRIIKEDASKKVQDSDAWRGYKLWPELLRHRKDNLMRPISICLFGLSKKPVGRIGAKTGDGIFATGRFGYSAAGLHLMLSGKKPANSFEVKAKKAFCRPDARLDFGAAAARHFSSSIDSSDGLAMSLHELAQSSRKRFLLEKIPTPPGLEEFAKKHKIKSDDLLFYGGEEYEIVFTVPQKQRSAVLALAAKHRACLVQIGTVTTGNGVYLKTDSGITRIQQRGWKRHTV